MFSPDVKRKNPKDIKGETRAKTRDKSMIETQELAISHKKVFTFVRKWKKSICLNAFLTLRHLCTV